MGFLVWEKIPSVTRIVGGPLWNRALWDSPIKMMAILRNAAKRTTLTINGMISLRKIDNLNILESNTHTIVNIIGNKA